MYENQNVIGHRAGANGTSSDTKSDDKSSPPNKNTLMKLKSYLIALRVWSLSASIIPTVLGEWESEMEGIVQQVFFRLCI